MIRGYSDHAANERTFVAWVRTGIAVIAFGFVVEKFNLFVLAMAGASAPDAGYRLHLQRLSGPFGRYDGLALILVGLALVVVAFARFVWTARAGRYGAAFRRQRPCGARPVDGAGGDCRRVQRFSGAQLTSRVT